MTPPRGRPFETSSVPRRSGTPPPRVPLPRTCSGEPGSARRVRTEMTPPRASDPNATEPGPRDTSMPSNVPGSANVALGPTRRSDVTRPPSTSSSVRPRARPRMAGTAACPSETWLTPGTVSSACIRFSGALCAICREESSVIPAAGVVVTLGATPTTVNDSSRSGLTASSTCPSTRSTVTGLTTCPAGKTMITWNGTSGRGDQVNRPSESVLTVPGYPAMDTVAPGTPVFDRSSMTRPVKDSCAAAAGGSPSATRATINRETDSLAGFTSSSIAAPDVTTRSRINKGRWQASSLAPFQLLPQHVEVAALRRAHQAQRAARPFDGHHIAGLQRVARLAIECHEHLVVAVHVRLDRDRRRAGHDQGAVGQHARGDRREQQRIDDRLHDRATRGEVVGRRSGGRGDDEAVGADLHHHVVADRHRQLDDARERGLGDHHVVQYQLVGEARTGPEHLRVQHHPFFDRCAPLEHAFKRWVQIVQRDLGQEAEAAEVDAGSRDIGAGAADAPGHPG